LAINDAAVITAASGYVFVAPPGTPAPTPTQLEAITVTGSPTSGTFTVTVGTDTTDAIDLDATIAEIQAALEALDTVGAANVLVAGGPLPGTAVTLTWVGKLQGKTLTVSATGSLTGGSSPAIAATVTTATNGWLTVGHTSREEMPEFGYDGGDSEIKGTWQNAQLRKVQTEIPADFVTFQLHQWDQLGLSLYYGPNASATPGVFGFDGGVVEANEYALLIIIVDGANKVGFHASKADIGRDDSVQTPVDEFASLPIRATFLKMPGRLLFSWISEALL
jgi:hypothetical protein